ncbi:MAG: redoxin domain-containing protein [bacterium]
MAITVGADAPDFTLKNQDKGDVTLSAQRGKKNVVLGFYVYDFSSTCEKENACFTSDLPKIEDSGAKVAFVKIHDGQRDDSEILAALAGLR